MELNTLIWQNNELQKNQKVVDAITFNVVLIFSQFCSHIGLTFADEKAH